MSYVKDNSSRKPTCKEWSSLIKRRRKEAESWLNDNRTQGNHVKKHLIGLDYFSCNYD